MRLYLPTTVALLAERLAGGEVGDAEDAVVAEADDEESEYLALMTAADASAELLDGAAASGAGGRRVVVVAELDRASGPVSLDAVVAVHADPHDRGPDADPDEDLAWYARQELAGLLGDTA